MKFQFHLNLNYQAEAIASIVALSLGEFGGQPTQFKVERSEGSQDR